MAYGPAFGVTVRLLEPSYRASTLDLGAAEWPPYPARVFRGLVSVADPSDPAQDAALRWPEEHSAPLVVALASGTAAREPGAHGDVPVGRLRSGLPGVPGAVR